MKFSPNRFVRLAVSLVLAALTTATLAVWAQARPLEQTTSTEAQAPVIPAVVTARPIATVTLPNQSGLEPYAMAVAANGDVFVTNNTSDDVSVVRGSAIVKRIPTGAGPLGIVFNPNNNSMYVANNLSDTVSV